MPIKIEIPTPMREITAGASHVTVTGSTVKEALADLVRQYPAIEVKLFNDGKLRQYINIFLNDEDIRYLDDLDTQVKDGELVALIPAVSGG
ncbi:ubiquitin-like small modifier protein 1 [Tuwongella immobilis]|uniref:Molybdopterin synthase sulfur carrier subunit n=1 Tax=Tuwongella immobilis TaxID=692036 RepID=A0A6C2YWM8_9BACT|nr:ubiquitin-like small modifier protein 1 [Tuwongella immobilis]VIP05767.1 MoaD family protein OS=Thermocrinis albus (strain DSM 14484 / JCM 11386 / HI 11/12) GN=Thal_1379 PE=4 SV=1: ThiS [Tuwongella immobilis]VTS08890.1 MoaD family protein OS=Thermocrinis albus (strain DSM 14484 / JCM 11386 / HI 11/12) GN=Thal_1379 PE=4 SV=1: ThiS [Tuwongella immobilis]